MHYEKRDGREGTYYSFVWYDTRLKKRVRLTKAEIRKRFGHDITDETEAKGCLKLLEAQYETEKIKIERRLAWEKEYYDFHKLLGQYEKVQRRKAPNSWQNNVFYLKHYVLPFFLGQKKLNNIDLWEDHFEEFRNWLEHKAVQLRSNKLISYSSKNHAIKSLNTFLSHLYKQKVILRPSKCDWFGDHMINKRTIDDVIKPEEMESIYDQLKQNGWGLEATLFRYLFFSGMRFHEGLAISLADIFQGKLPENQLLAKKLKNLGIKYYGYIVSDSQVDDKWERRPFKGKKQIGEKNSRTIPIVDKVLWNDLVELAENKYGKWKNSSEDKRYCFLFEGIDDTTASRRLQEAFSELKLRYRSWHCLRHSRATWLIGDTGDEVLAKAWLGHSSARTFERYNHIYQAMIREAKSKASVGADFKLKKVD